MVPPGADAAAAHGAPSSGGDDSRVARRSRLAGAALVLVLLAVSVFAVWTSVATSRASAQAVRANGLSDDYARAATAVMDEESLEHKYRLEPGPQVRASYVASTEAFVAALAEVRRDGTAPDRAFADDLLALHATYLLASEHLFQAVDRGDPATAHGIDSTETDPAFEQLQDRVQDAAADHHDVALRRLHRLQQMEARAQVLTPAVFLTGLGLAALLASVTRGHRRQLVDERARAVHDALHDALTGLANRSLLAQRFDLALARDRGAGTATGLLLIDIDRFKEINDTFGHHYGDELLTQIGPRLAPLLREADTVARLGGDEFAVLLPGLSCVDDARAVASALVRALEEPFRVADVDLDIEASVGVVLSGEHGRDATTLLQHADVAMYAAKSLALGVATYDPDVDGHSPARLALLGDLRRALDRGELTLHYQPKISLSTGDVLGAEALLRWQHPTRGWVPPDEFVPVAEQTGLIGPLTRHVLSTALAQARAWALAGQPMPVSVNLSARNLLDERLPALVADLLDRYDLPARMLELEVTESALMVEPVRSRRLLEELSGLGATIAVDDFGAGYTSIGQLRTLPVDDLKIDKSFVLAMTEDAGDAAIVRSVIELGHSLGLTVIAEGVETEQALSALQEFGCDVAQGHHLGRPVDADTLLAWLRGRTVSARARPRAQALPWRRARSAATTTG